MKRFSFFFPAVLVVILFFRDDCFAQNCLDSSFNLGTVDAHWMYKNESLKISFQLPEGWYLYDYMPRERRYLRIGSDYRKISSAMFEDPTSTGPVLDIAQLKKLHFGYEPTLLSLARIEDTASMLVSPNEKQDTSISFSAYYADTTDINFFLKSFYKKINPNRMDSPEIRRGRIGNLDYQFFSVTAPNKSGLMQNNQFCARNFGCLNLMMRITYLTETGRSRIFDACQELKLAK